MDKETIRNIISNYYISLVLGRSVMLEEKHNYNYVDMQCFSVDVPSPPQQPSASQSMGEVMQALIKYLPEYLQVIEKETPGYNQAMLDIAKQQAPQEYQTVLDLMKQYGSQYADVGNQINLQNALAQAQNESQVLSGPGMELVQQARQAEQVYDPEKEAARSAILNKAQELANSLSPNLTGSEQAEVERYINRSNLNTGTYNTPSVSNTVANATQFASALQNKKSQLSQVLGQAASTVAGLTKPVDVFSVATGRPVTANWGQNQYQSPNLNPSGAVSSYASGLFNAGTGLQESAMNNTASQYGAYVGGLTRAGSPFGNVMSGLGSLGGFLWGSGNNNRGISGLF